MKKTISLLLAFILALTCSFFLAEGEPASAEMQEANGEVILFDDSGLETEMIETIPQTDPDHSESLNKAVIGADNRITVSNPSQWPYCSIAYLDVVGECNCHWSGSGFLVGDSGILLTAAHCLVCTEHSSWAKNISFYFGYKNAKSYLYRYTGWWSAYVGNTFPQRNYSIEKDFGIVKLDASVNKGASWLGAYWASSDSDMQNFYVNVAGYRDNKLRYDSGYMSVLDNDHVSFLMDEMGGNSGGPIFTNDGMAVGSIIAECEDQYGRPVYNIGYRLTYEVWQQIEKLRLQ